MIDGQVPLLNLDHAVVGHAHAHVAESGQPPAPGARQAMVAETAAALGATVDTMDAEHHDQRGNTRGPGRP